MQRLRTVTSLDVSAAAGHHAMPAALLLTLKSVCVSERFAKLTTLYLEVMKKKKQSKMTEVVKNSRNPTCAWRYIENPQIARQLFGHRQRKFKIHVI